MADLRALKDEAAGLAAAGKLDRAAEAWRRVVAADPADVASQQRLAEVLRRAGRAREAVEAYRGAADRYARGGLLAKAIALSKIILEIEPGHAETQAALADLHARRTRPAAAPPSAPAAPGLAPAPRTRPAAIAPDPPPPAATAFQRIAAAAAAAIAAAGADAEEIVLLRDLEDAAEPEEAPPRGAAPAAPAGAVRLGTFPLLSDLSREAFLALAAGMVLRRVVPGEEVLRQGDGGASFFLVAAGRLSVSRRDEAGREIVVGRLGEGDFFGEMALLSGAPRAATVRAEQEGELLELRPDVLLAVAGRHPHLAASLRRFYRRRLLANAMATSPVLRPFASEERKRILSRFLSREVGAGEVVVREGDPSDGLYVLLDGEVDVVKRAAGAEVEVARLGAGDLFGETSCLRKAPATATVRVRRGGTLLRLPRADFDELVSSHPPVLELVATLSEERADGLDAIVSGRARWTEDGLVLV